MKKKRYIYCTYNVYIFDTIYTFIYVYIIYLYDRLYLLIIYIANTRKMFSGHLEDLLREHWLGCAGRGAWPCGDGAHVCE